MESFHYSNSSDDKGLVERYSSFSGNYDFTQDNLASIPYPDDMEEDQSIADEVDLPPPPGAADDEPLPSFHLKNKPPFLNTSPECSPFLLSEFDAADIPMPDQSEKILSKMSPQLFSSHNDNQQNDDNFSKVIGSEGELGDFENDFKKSGDDNKYSPSKVESDEENQDFINVKPKVLGKEQAKKRLMAFSLSKQPITGVKKQNKIVTPLKTSKEKPPNPNKSSGVQEQFRATISAIEEEKKKMMQNMPNYLLLEMNELSKSTHPIIKPSMQMLDKGKNENADSGTKDSSNKNDSVSHKSNESTKVKDFGKKSRRSGSLGRSCRRSHSRSRQRRRSRSRSRRRSRSPSKSKKRSRSRSRTRKSRTDKNYKSDKNKDSLARKILFVDWKSFKALDFATDISSGQSKQFSDETRGHKEEHSRRSPSPKLRGYFKPIFNYLKKGSRMMTYLKAKPADHENPDPILFPEKAIKYTRAKPIVIWSENPAHATEYYMPVQLLLENCDQGTAGILQLIMENKNKQEADVFFETKSLKTRQWYPRKEYLLPTLPIVCKELKADISFGYNKLSIEQNEEKISPQRLEKKHNDNDDKKEVKGKEESKFENVESTKQTKRERHISLVNDSYLSDEEAKVKEMVVGNVKVQLDLGLNCVKVRSKWDSDYEGDNSEREAISRRDDDMEIATPEGPTEQSSLVKEKFTTENFTLEPILPEQTNKKVSKSPNSLQSQNIEASDPLVGNLASEYEEFLKMVSFNSKESQETENQNAFLDAPPGKLEKQKVTKAEKGEEVEKTRKFGTTDWDQESDREEKPPGEKVPYGKNESPHDFSLLKDDKSGGKKKKNKKGILAKKKIEKLKQKKNKLSKKSGKVKKKKYEDSSSSESSSDSYDSDSDSDSEDSKFEKKKKKKRASKAKKKSKRDSSSESDSDSNDSRKSRKKKSKKKKDKKKKKNESGDSEDEMKNVPLKQLDFKKQLIIKKIEEIDSISERSGKKKEKDSRQKKEKENLDDSDITEKYVKSGKKKKTEEKLEKVKKKSKMGGKKRFTRGKSKESRKDRSSSESDSESSESNGKKKKGKREGKKKMESSESSSDREKIVKSTKVEKLTDMKNFKSLEKTAKKIKKMKKDKKKDYSSSDSDSDDSSPRVGKKVKKKKPKNDENKDEGSRLSWKENFLLEEPVPKTGERQFEWEDKKSWERKTKIGKEGGDWEASSSLEESLKESKTRESSWDDEVPLKPEFSAEITSKSEICKMDDQSTPGSEVKEKNAPEMISQPLSETLKTSLSNFSFNENSFCSFGQELSRDFFLTDRSFSNSAGIGCDGQIMKTLDEDRPFQSVNKINDVKKLAESERYSPGYSDSEVSDIEANSMSERPSSNSNVASASKGEVYDPLECDSEASAENNEVELSSIPLPCVSEILLPGETRNFEDGMVPSAEGKLQKSSELIGTKKKENEGRILPGIIPALVPKISFSSSDFTPVATPQSPFSDEKTTPTKKQIISVKAQQKLKSKAASVFQDDDSDEENPEVLNKTKARETVQVETVECLKRKVLESEEKVKGKTLKKDEKFDESIKDEEKRGKKEDRERSRERSGERERRRRRSGSREKRGSSKSGSGKGSSPNKRRRSRTPTLKPKDPEKREIRSDSFEIEPLKGPTDSGELGQGVQPIPVLTSFGVSSDRPWTRSQLPGYTCDFSTSGTLIDHPESFDIYPSEDSKSRNLEKDQSDRDEGSGDKLAGDKLLYKDERSKKERKKSRSRSSSPRKRRRSKSPERRRSPRRRSVSPKRGEKSPYSPRRRSPKRKSPSRRYRTSRSPDRRRKSRSRSPRKRRGSPLRRSRSLSPRKHRSPKRRGDSPRSRRGDSSSRTFSPRGSVSPRKDTRFSHSYSSNVQNRIPVIGASCDDADMDASPSAVRSPRFEISMGFPPLIHQASINDSEINNGFYNNREYGDEFGVTNYSEEANANNLITVKNHDIEKTNSPERLSLDQRIELELGVQLSSGSQAQSDQYPMPNQRFQDPNHFPNSYNCESNNASNDNFYQNPDFNGQYFNGHQQPPNYGPFQQYPNGPTQSSVMQVGNIVEVVPAMQQLPPPPVPHASKAHQIMQVGNVLQVVPSLKVAPGASMPPPAPHNYGASTTSPLVKTQKATAVVAPSSIIPTPNPEAVINPLIKAIQLEREKRRKEKEKRKAEREARRKARQLRREAKLMSVNEKLKKSVQDEGLMLGQEVEDDELLDSLDLPSPPIPVEIITVSSQSTLPPAGKGILITAGFMPKPPSEKKEVKFADGVCPGEGTSSSANEDVASPPPKPKLPKEKRFKKKKTKVKKKVKVQIIRQIIQSEDDDDDDDLSPPPPPPGDPPPVFFARFPFAGDAQFPVYQTQTTTTTLTTVQYPAQSFQ